MRQIRAAAGFLTSGVVHSLFLFFSPAADFHVSPSGDDANAGSATMPWRTIQKAAETVPADSNVLIHEGTYEEKVDVQVSGAAGQFITFQAAPGEKVIIEGGNLPFSPNDSNALFTIRDQSFIRVKDLELRNYRTSQRYLVPIAILVEGAASNVEILDNRIHHIETNYNGEDGGDAHGIAVFGYETTPLENVLISRNELFDLKLGSSEALVLNGNVRHFEVSDNVVRDCNNIAIDFIGFEETGPTPALDQARDGVCRGNLVYNITSASNPAYGGSFTNGGGDTSAGGIYVDGGTRVLIEQNTVHHCDIGIELASEHAGRSTSEITVRNNLIFHNQIGGIFMGGYDRMRGMTRDCEILNNTLFQNDTKEDGNGEIYLQYDVEDCTIQNNILSANEQGLLIGNPFSENDNNLVNYNLYSSTSGAPEWQWKRVYYTSFQGWKTATGNDADSIAGDPDFQNSAGFNFRLRSTSAARDTGNPSHPTGTGETDYLLENRIENSRVDIGAIEYSGSPHSVSLVVTGNGMAIANEDESPSTSDGTDLGESVWRNGEPIDAEFLFTNNGTATLRPAFYQLAAAGQISLPFPFHMQQVFASLPPGATRTLQVRFAPESVGESTVDAIVSGAHSSDDAFRFRLTGIGIAPESLPDLMVGSSSGQKIGNGIYEGAGSQLARRKIKRRTGTGWFHAENDGTLVDDLSLKATKKNRFFSPKYHRTGGSSPGNVTAKMISGTETVSLASGTSQLYRLRIKASRKTRGRKKKRKFYLNGFSVHSDESDRSAFLLIKRKRR